MSPSGRPEARRRGRLSGWRPGWSSGWLRRDDGADVGSLRRQLIVLTGVVAALVAIALVVIVQVVLAGTATEAVARVLADRADAVTGATREGPDGRLQVPAAQLGPGVAVYDAAGRLVAGQIPDSLREDFARLSGSTGLASGQVGDDDYELLARPFATDGGTTGVVVAAEPLGPYENDEADALAVSVAAGLVIVVLAVALTAWSSRRVLAPVAAMARTAEQWSDRDLERRFDLGDPTNEIRALGHTLDGLLDRVAQAILAEQRLTSELAHELRTPLTAIQATAELAGMSTAIDDQLREDLADIEDSCAQMSATVTGLLDLARGRSSTAAHEACDLGEVMESIRQAMSSTSSVLRLEIPPVRVAAPAELVRRSVGPVVDNAVRMATTVVWVDAVLDGRLVRVFVSDDGPGVPAGISPHLFDPGHTTGDDRTGLGGTGLGLSLARRVARSVGGDVELADRAQGAAKDPHGAGRDPASAPTVDGAVFVVSLPVA